MFLHMHLGLCQGCHMQLCFLGGKGLPKPQTRGPILPLQPPTSLDADVWSYFLQLLNEQRKPVVQWLFLKSQCLIFQDILLGSVLDYTVAMLQLHITVL